MFFFFNDPATTEIYTLSLHDALPIFDRLAGQGLVDRIILGQRPMSRREIGRIDRKSTRLNSSHGYISYAVFCLKKKKKNNNNYTNCMHRESIKLYTEITKPSVPASYE